MSSNLPPYKILRKMLEELESGKTFAKRLKGRCFNEVFFDDVERITELSPVSTSRTIRFNSYRRDSIFKRYPLAVAASVSLLLVSFYLVFRLFSPNLIVTYPGELKIVELPDHSMVTVNSNSELSYNPISWYWNRDVELKGEAFFEVEKGSEFTVFSDNGEVKVLGTSFNIIDRDDQYEVVCKTGKVSVNTLNQNVILNPNEEAKLLADGSLRKAEKETFHVASWKEGYFFFDSETLENVVLNLENQYGIDIKLNTQDNHLFSGYFPIKNAENSLETVCTALGLKYYKAAKGEQIIIE